MTSPAAYTSGFEVERSSFTFTPRAWYSTPAASKPKPCTFGARPVATKMASHTITFDSPPGNTTDTRISGQGCAGVCANDSTLTPVRISTPSCRRTLSSTADASGSSGPRMRSMPSSTVTSEPKDRKAWAISKPIGPPPKTAKRGGNSVKLNKVAFVKYGASARPGIGGTLARAPAAITAFRKRSVWLPTFNSFLPVNSAWPM
mmetsp:Transcript_3614/g.10556  ORF Transcript_3614/g.10556 Transcript_3614/m.10556 type:complete len:203 (+) Transcript_3614:590-1198(+)